ncbi:MAG TPA: HAD family hydrolase [Patescibacteria group bacterium]|nr:HAD family hydrolase [Patescibacteria group bacterium]
MSKNKPSIKHIWFDFAGTLYRETPEFVHVHESYRYKTYGEVVGISDMEQAKKEYDQLYQQYGSNSAVFKHLGKSDNYWQQAVDSLDRKIFFFPDKEVIGTLDSLRKIVPISIYSNFMLSKIQEMLTHLEIPEAYFTYILTGDDIEKRKPALDGFYKMIELSQQKAGRSLAEELPPNQLVYVGDREAVDIIPAKNVGMQTVLLYGNGRKTVADHSFDSFQELCSLV